VRGCHGGGCREVQVRQTQVGYDEIAARRPGSKREAKTCRRNRSDSDQQERLPHRLANPLQRAEALSKRAKQSVPREFTRVASNLDESCGEEDFDKARISIDWLNTCLANYNKDYSLGFCTRDKSYFCAINPRSDACLQSQ